MVFTQTNAFPSLTPTWRSGSYPAIDPSRAELSAKGKSVLITGGGSGGIGAGIAKAFAAAGATQIAILGRRENKLLESKAAIHSLFPEVNVLTTTADISNQQSINAAFSLVLKEFQKIDICVSNAGAFPAFNPVASAEIDNYWIAFETNVKGFLHVSQAFLRSASPGSVLINMSTALAHTPPIIPGCSHYAASKAAALKISEFIADENPDIQIVNMHPGNVESGMNPAENLPTDHGTSKPLCLARDSY
jgi:NAD(P)-dependent dehydrogenase (short-subunit alcohol dehydrogenase family)